MQAEEQGRGEKIYGYARVSSKDQNLARQLDALAEFGVEPRRIFTDKVSGKDFARPSYQRLVRAMRSGDVLVIKSIDRLGRSYEDVLAEWRHLTKERGLHIVVLDMPLLDTRANRGGLTGEFIADMVLQLLSYMAQIERDNIRRRQAEGIAAARARGIRFGRPPIEKPRQYAQMKVLYLRGEASCSDASRVCGVSRSTFLRWVHADEMRMKAVGAITD